ncbi:hypothetical protein [Bacillus sp. FJAT-44742]|uniref:hypothetical protein n=1 Tax=Bacillus sp. FJAT-44742 TaxID=2014005 RepID=UPI000C232553|nr:hypothetical protein [Bacillus sp. FJAT-44742]
MKIYKLLFGLLCLVALLGACGEGAVDDLESDLERTHYEKNNVTDTTPNDKVQNQKRLQHTKGSEDYADLYEYYIDRSNAHLETLAMNIHGKENENLTDILEPIEQMEKEAVELLALPVPFEFEELHAIHTSKMAELTHLKNSLADCFEDSDEHECSMVEVHFDNILLAHNQMEIVWTDVTRREGVF